MRIEIKGCRVMRLARGMELAALGFAVRLGDFLGFHFHFANFRLSSSSLLILGFTAMLVNVDVRG